MKSPWLHLRPSSQPALTQAEFELLPAGNLVLAMRSREDGCRWHALRLLKTDPPRGCVWTPIGWGDPLDFDPNPFELRLPRLPRLACSPAGLIRQRRKNVARRVWRKGPGWAQAGRWILLVDKIGAAGATALAVVELVDVRVEPLSAISSEEIRREAPDAFVEAFCQLARISPDTLIHRLEWSYLDGDPLFD